MTKTLWATPAPDNNSTIESSRAQGIGRPEIALVAATVGAGLVLRLWQIWSATLDHFDEGVYALSALAASEWPIGMYENQEVFSPPLFFGLGGQLTRFFGFSPDQSLLLVSALFGGLTVLAVWWIGTRWFGRAAGVAAAVLLSLNAYHIVFSRTALTDVTFTFFFLCAIGMLVAAIEKENVVLATLGGLLTGMAWNTKYHGWFALLITGVALVPFLYQRRGTLHAWRRPVVCWLVAAAVAGLSYLPWFLLLADSSRGLSGFASYYSTLISMEWLSRLWHHISMQLYLEGPTSRIAVPLGLLAALIINTNSLSMTRRFLAAVALFAGIAIAAGSLAAAFVGGLVMLPVLLRGKVPFHVWVLLGWIGLWMAAAPLYRPYARLLLPFIVALFLLAGAAFSWLATWASGAISADAPRKTPAFGSLLVVAVLLVVCLIRPADVRPWNAERGMRVAAPARDRSERCPSGGIRPH